MLQYIAPENLQKGCFVVPLFVEEVADDAFHDRVQHFNWDLSAVALNTFACVVAKEKEQPTNTNDIIEGNPVFTFVQGNRFEKGLHNLEALANMCYAQVVAGVKQIIANGVSYGDLDNIQKNIQVNDVANN